MSRRLPRRVRTAAADALGDHCRNARALFLGGGIAGALPKPTCTRLASSWRPSIRTGEDLERPLATLGGDLADIARGVVAEWLEPATWKPGPRPLPAEEWTRRAVLAAALSLWKARHKKVGDGATVIAHAVYGPAQASAKAADIIGWRKRLEGGEAPAEVVGAYREMCQMFGELPPNIGSEQNFPELVRNLMSGDLTRSKDFRTLYGESDPRMART